MCDFVPSKNPNIVGDILSNLSCFPEKTLNWSVLKKILTEEEMENIIEEILISSRIPDIIKCIDEGLISVSQICWWNLYEKWDSKDMHQLIKIIRQRLNPYIFDRENRIGNWRNVYDNLYPENFHSFCRIHGYPSLKLDDLNIL